MFAKVHITRGTRIIAEKGLLSLPDNQTRQPSISEALRAFRRLSPLEKVDYIKLHSSASTNMNVVPRWS